MKNSKVIAIICWGISVVAFLAALLLSEGSLSKNVIFTLGLAILWFIAGIIYWKKGSTKEE